MTNYQFEKDLVRTFHRASDAAAPAALRDIFAQHCAPDLTWYGYHPFNTLNGPDAVVEAFWSPLKTSLRHMQRREDIFFAGENTLPGQPGIWVVSMGHLLGLFDAPWLGIQPSHKMAMLRYCSFHRVAEGAIQETAFYIDIPHLMAQAGQGPFPTQTAQHFIQPGPLGHGGCLYTAQPTEEGTKTLAAINAMITDLGQWKLGLPLEEELARTWHDDMIWWGPEGIGATYTIARYAKQHSGPFRAAFSERTKTQHIARLAEGHYGGFFGNPNFTARLTGPFMGHPATGKTGSFRVIDLYRRAGDKLAENWVFIDLLHFWKDQGIDILNGDRL